jgi:hypothetical protein
VVCCCKLRGWALLLRFRGLILDRALNDNTADSQAAPHTLFECADKLSLTAGQASETGTVL